MALLLLSPIAIALLSCNLASPLDGLPPLKILAGCHSGLVVVASPLVTPPPLKAPAHCHFTSQCTNLLFAWLVVASPHRNHHLLMRWLVVTSPLILPPSCLPRLVAPSPLVATPPLNTSLLRLIETSAHRGGGGCGGGEETRTHLPTQRQCAHTLPN